MDGNNDRERVRSAIVEMVEAWAPSHFVTLTFSYDCTAERAWHAFHDWVRTLEAQGWGRIGWWCITESTHARCVHLHALLVVPPGEAVATAEPERLEELWTHGHSRVRRFDAERGAAWYVTKTLARYPEAMEAWDFRAPAPRPVLPRGDEHRRDDQRS